MKYWQDRGRRNKSLGEFDQIVIIGEAYSKAQNGAVYV